MSCRSYSLPNVDLDYRNLDDLFAPSAVLRSWLDVERAVALAQGELGMIPGDAAETIVSSCRPELLDADRMARDAITTRHPLMPLLNELVRLAGPDHGGYVHWGITTQNVIQTAALRTAKKAHRTLLETFRQTFHHLGKRALRYADTPMPGRTHSRHAVPITFGFKVAGWIEEMMQSVERLEAAAARSFVVMMGGAVGSHSALGEDGPAFQTRVAQMLEMGEMAVPSRAIRTHICDYANALALSAAVCHRIAEEVYRASSEEHAEFSECRSDGAIGSSTMPQKVNPILCCQIIANASRIYARMSPMLAMASRPFEADASANAIFETDLGQMIELFVHILGPTEALLRDLQVDPDRMRRNLDLSHGTIHSEYLMMEFGRHIGKARSHELIHQAVAGSTDAASFRDAVFALPEGPAVLKGLGERLENGGGMGLCSRFAHHLGTLAVNVEMGKLPAADLRTLSAVRREVV